MTVLDERSPWDAVAAMVDGDALVASLRDVVDRARARGSAPRLRVVGPPGSGRSTLARHIGPLLAAEGILAWAGGVEESALMLLGEDPGQVATQVRATLSSARGGTLVLRDDAGTGHPTTTGGAPPIEGLVAELAGPDWHDTAVVLIREPAPVAGDSYERLVHNCFPDVVVRPGYDAGRCLALLRVLLSGGERPQTAEPAFVHAFEALARTAVTEPGFDNGDWVERVLSGALSRMRRRVVAAPDRYQGEGRRRLVLDDLQTEIHQTTMEGS